MVPARVPVCRLVTFGRLVSAQHGRPGDQDGLREGHAHAQEQACQNVSLIRSLHARMHGEWVEWRKGREWATYTIMYYAWV